MSVKAIWRGEYAKNRARAASRAALRAGAEHLKERSNAICPIEESTLIRSSGVSVSADGKVAAVYYGTPYARRQHEELTWRHDPGRQAKYLEEPARREHKTIQRIIATHMRRALQG